MVICHNVRNLGIIARLHSHYAERSLDAGVAIWLMFPSLNANAMNICSISEMSTVTIHCQPTISGQIRVKLSRKTHYCTVRSKVIVRLFEVCRVAVRLFEVCRVAVRLFEVCQITVRLFEILRVAVRLFAVCRIRYGCLKSAESLYIYLKSLEGYLQSVDGWHRVLKVVLIMKDCIDIDMNL